MTTTNKKTAGYNNFTELYNKNYSEILTYIRFKTNNLHVSEEICDDVFIKANNHINTFDENKSKLTTWLKFIANNCIIDYYRADKSKNYVNVSQFADAETGKEIFQFVSDTQADTEIENAELLNKINFAFNGLKDNYLQIAKLFFLEEKTHNEICTLLNLPLTTVKVMIFRCREKLQANLQTEKKLYCIN